MPDGLSGLTGTRRVSGQTLQLGNCLSCMAVMPAASFDVVVTSPPYNIGLDYSLYNDSRHEVEYVAWLGEVAQAIKRVLKSNGSFFLNIAGSNTRPYLPFEVASCLREGGFFLQNHITWIKSIGMEKESKGHFKPVGGKRFMHHNHEHIFHLTQHNDVQLDRLAIGLPFQDKTNIARRGHARDLRCRGNTWFIPYSTVRSKAQKFNHPGTFPIELPLWCIFLHGGAGLRVLDPFVGSGTTLVASRLAQAIGVGIDIDPNYIKIASERLLQLGEGALDITLNQQEVQELMKQDPSAEGDGGWQNLQILFQKRVNKTTGHLTFTSGDLEQIKRYAFNYNKGGWQARLIAIFGRSLGPKLDGAV